MGRKPTDKRVTKHALYPVQGMKMEKFIRLKANYTNITKWYRVLQEDNGVQITSELLREMNGVLNNTSRKLRRIHKTNAICAAYKSCHELKEILDEKLREKNAQVHLLEQHRVAMSQILVECMQRHICFIPHYWNPHEWVYVSRITQKSIIFRRLDCPNLEYKFDFSCIDSQHHAYSLCFVGVISPLYIPIELHILTFPNQLTLLPKDLLGYVLEFLFHCKIKNATK